MALQPTTVAIRGILSYPKLAEKVAFEKNDPAFSTTVLIPKEDTETIAKVEAAIRAAIEKDVNGKKKAYMQVPAVLPKLLKDGDEKLDKDGNQRPEFAGMWFLNVSNKYDDSITLANKMVQVTDKKVIKDSFVGGLEADVYVDFWTYQYSGRKGVSTKLLGANLTGHGEPFGGSSDVADMFGIVKTESVFEDELPFN